MSQKNDLRKQLEVGMSMFLSSGKNVTKLPTYGKKREPKPKQQVVEIEVEFLPTALKNKYFGE